MSWDFDIRDLAPERDELDRYLEDTITIDWQTPAVTEKARELCLAQSASESDEPSGPAKRALDEQTGVRVLFEFVRDEIAHSDDIDTDIVTCNASQVLREKTGLCYAKCHLLAALLRSRGVPCGFCYQRIRSESNGGGFVVHGLLAVYLHSLERWILLDPRGNNADVQSEYRVEPPSLVWKIDPDAGEGIYARITTRPAKRVLDLLDHADSLAQIKSRLPDKI